MAKEIIHNAITRHKQKRQTYLLFEGKCVLWGVVREQNNPQQKHDNLQDIGKSHQHSAKNLSTTGEVLTIFF